MLRKAVFFLAFLSNIALSAQNGFDATYGPAGTWSRAIDTLPSGGFLVLSYLETNGYTSLRLMRLDDSGDTLWTRNYGDDTTQFKTYDMHILADGNIIVCGDYQQAYTYPNMDSYIMKLDSSGNLIWFNKYGVTNENGGGKDFGNKVYSSVDGQLFVTGWAKHSFTDSAGILNHGLFQGYIASFDSAGTITGIKSFVYMTQADTEAWQGRFYPFDVVTAGTRIFVAAERYDEASGLRNGVIFCLDADLDTLFTYSCPAGVTIGSLEKTKDSHLVIAGDQFMMKMDTAGAIIGQQSATMPRVTEVREWKEKGYVVLCGETGLSIASDVNFLNFFSIPTLVYVDSMGTYITQQALFTTDMLHPFLDFVVADSAVITLSGKNPQGNWIVQLDSSGNVPVSVRENSIESQVSAYPNPASDEIIVDLSLNGSSTYVVCDLAGKPVLSGLITSGGRAIINIASLEPGVYILQVKGEGTESAVCRIVKQ